ncbi:MAG: response regulator [Bacteroidia bacterium]|nr:response regulator [Bacteroidia bacterium]MCZ2276848.1 response regulator [Bacteroidia bacterium]
MYTENEFKISLIDDEPDYLEKLKSFLISHYPKSQISIYNSGEEAIANIFEQPDLIILDYQLDSINPVAMNGIQVLQKLKQKFAETPVVFISLSENPEIAAHTIKFGAYDYLVKGEHTFQKAEILLNNIFSHGTIRKNLKSQKFFNRLLVLLLVGLFVWILIMAFGGSL